MLGLPTRLLSPHRPLQRFSAPAIFGLSRKFSFCRRIRRSRLQRPGFSRRRSEQHGYRRNGSVPKRHRPARRKSWHPHHSHSPLRRVSNEARAPPPCPLRRTHRSNRRASFVPSGHFSRGCRKKIGERGSYFVGLTFKQANGLRRSNLMEPCNSSTRIFRHI